MKKRTGEEKLIEDEQYIQEHQWPCFECSEQFTSSKDLQNHLNIHEENREPLNSNKKNCKTKKKLLKVAISEAWQCKICEQVFNPSKSSVLKQHFLMKHDGYENNIEENFVVIRYEKNLIYSVIFRCILKAFS